jgi:hypothetical protein
MEPYPLVFVLFLVLDVLAVPVMWLIYLVS